MSGVVAAHSSPRIHRARAIAAASIGNAFEWYDFSVFVLFAPYLAAAMFPGDSQTAGLVKTLLAFGVGFVARPVGAILIGYFGDYAGRKAALTLTFGLMALGTLILAVTPGHATIGAAAPILVLVGRLLQGLSAGGEIGGAASFLVEHAPAGRKAIYAAWLQASMAVSNILGALVALAVGAAMSEATIAAWGWRVPFLFGLMIVPIGIWLRATLDETPDFVAARSVEGGAPILATLRQEGANVARGFGISVLWGVSVYALVIFLPVHVQKALGFSAREAFSAALVGNLLLIAASFVSGRLADRIGRRTLMMATAAALLVATPMLMALLVSVHALPMLIFAQASFCALVGLFAGAVPAILVELFPTQVRSTGTSLAYNGALTLFGGFAPAIVTWLSTTPLGPQASAYYVSASAVVALIAIATFRKGR